MERIEQKLDELLALMNKWIVKPGSVKEAKRLAGAQKRKADKVTDLSGRLPLPERHPLKVRDPRLSAKHAGWALKALEFGRQNRLPDFLRWFVWEWNANTYHKKVITYSQGYLRVSLGGLCRHPYTPRDLLGVTQRAQVRLRSEAELDDFQSRLWWHWAYLVLLPVWNIMEENAAEFAKVHPKFRRGLQILLSGYGCLEIDGEPWDTQHDLKTVNRMLKKIGPDLHLCIHACLQGLRLPQTTTHPATKVI